MWGFGVLGFWGFGVLGFWGFGVLGFWAEGTGSPTHTHFRLRESQDAHMRLRIPSIQPPQRGSF